ncbi:MAG: hypothetical protein WBX01_14895 [Nitrososphaeraceae archaeon]
MSKDARELSEQEANQLEKIFELATGSPGFRKLLSVDPSSAIDRTSNRLGFTSGNVSPEVIDVVASLTEEELSVLATINKKTLDIGIRPHRWF